MFCASCCASKGADTDAKQDVQNKTRDALAEEEMPMPGRASTATAPMWVQFGAVDFRCRGCSPELAKLVGSLPDGSSVLEVLGGDQLRRVVQQSINELCYSEEAPGSMTVK